MNIEEKFISIYGDDDMVGSKTNLSFFKDNLDMLEKVLARAKKNKNFKKENKPAYGVISEFLFNEYGLSQKNGKPLSTSHIGRYYSLATKWVNKVSVKTDNSKTAPKVEVKKIEKVAPVVEPKATTPNNLIKKSLEQLKLEGWDEDKAIDFIYDIYQDWSITFKPMAFSQQLEDAVNFYLLEVANYQTIKDNGHFDFKGNMKLKDLVNFLERNKRVPK